MGAVTASRGSSPATTGPAGPQFEGKVGAAYLVAMLAGAPPRGLPGTTIDRIQFQRAAEGHPLDDVIVHAHDALGTAAVLEVQCKRSLSAAPSDEAFAAALDQAVRATATEGFWARHHELAIAFARPKNAALLSAYPDLLLWAQKMGTAAEFFARLSRPGAASEDMRTFVGTVRARLTSLGAAVDNESLFRFLGRLQLLMFDFASPGSQSEEFVLERCAQLLPERELAKAGALWGNLSELAIDSAANGGELTHERVYDHLLQRGITLAGQRQYAPARAALAEAAQLALGDIRDAIGQVQLLREAPLAAVRAAHEQGRYIEIRGEGGVGKSAVLKHVAQQLARESPILLCSPGRVPSGGWMALRAQLGFEGRARELLVDLASTGAAVLLIDGLESLNAGERKTVADLMRIAADIPGFTVMVTTRHSPEGEETAWLPAEALDRLGRAEPVVIAELTDKELRTLADADPGLAVLVSPDHPARDVMRNLYRLARLTQRPSSDPVRSEIDLADQWWHSADGDTGAAQRDRARVLRALAEQALARAEPLEVPVASSSTAVEELIRSGSLRDLYNDRVAFQHDVLREWAMGELLDAEPARIEGLPLTSAAPATLARGVELAARRALEKSTDAKRWRELLGRVSQPGAHGSWRRVVLLALIRSEVGVELLLRVEEDLLAHEGRLLRELIQTARTIEVEPAVKYLAKNLSQEKAKAVPPWLDVPRIRSWARLVTWLLVLGQRLPTALIASVAKVYTVFIAATGGVGSFTPKILERLYAWLIEIEEARHAERFGSWREAFGGQVPTEEIEGLETRLRAGFVGYSQRRPDLAAKYLHRLLQWGPSAGNTLFEVLKFPGSLAQAAPAELAELTVRALIPASSAIERKPTEAFNYIDHRFIEASAEQGPFLKLLRASPLHGLRLVRQLLDHACEFYSEGRPPGENGLKLPLPTGARRFPWIASYAWPREGAGHTCLTSALMALEAWGHERIEAGEPIEKVLSDVLGEPGGPAAYVAVAVDLVLSHWPASAHAAIPFLASPELLCLDRERQVYDQLQARSEGKVGDRVVLGAPIITRAILEAQASRRRRLQDLLSEYARGAATAWREGLTGVLREARERLGDPGAGADWSDPAFMAAHALNAVNPDHYEEVQVTAADGRVVRAWRYVAPEIEAQYFESMARESQELLQGKEVELALSLALDNPARSSPELAARAVQWAQALMSEEKEGERESSWIRGHAELVTALIVMRDGDDRLRGERQGWARDVFLNTVEQAESLRQHVPDAVRFNPLAMAFVGFAHLGAPLESSDEVVRGLLEIAAHGSLAGAAAFPVVVERLAEMDERLPKAVLRCALQAAIGPVIPWDGKEAEKATLRARYDERRRRAVEAEVGWLTGTGSEPQWPSFPAPSTRPVLTIRLGQLFEEEDDASWEEATELVDHAGAAAWVQGLWPWADSGQACWLPELLQYYASWTHAANGTGLRGNLEPVDRPLYWNQVFYGLLPLCVTRLDRAAQDAWILPTVEGLPDGAFFDALAVFVHVLDTLYFEHGLSGADALHMRTALAQRLMASRSWKELYGDRSSRIEMHLGPAVARMFFNLFHGFGQPPHAYVLPGGMEQVRLFWPVLLQLLDNAPSFWTAVFIVDLLEVAPGPSDLTIVVTALDTLMQAFPDDQGLWVDHEIGRRFCAVIETIRVQEPRVLRAGEALRDRVDRLLGTLVRVGVASAARLEKNLAGDA